MRLNKSMIIILVCIMSAILIPAYVYSQATQPKETAASVKAGDEA